MSDSDWSKLKYMTKKDNWGDPAKMSKNLVYNLENLRIFVGKPLTLTCPAYTPGNGHSQNSQHYFGNAADWTVKGLSILNMYILAERFNFTGIGLYPNNGNPFVHTDVRETDCMNVQCRWIAVPGGSGAGGWTYLEMSEENLRKYCL